uniref:NR LBD domain-containing protein n=1 Tax=Syphacia muris TaxID=451379 RepID=A0A0N5AS07_9BILA
MCNNIDSDKTRRIIQRASVESRPNDVTLLQQIGLKKFTAQFFTVPPSFMKEVIHMACSKHEQQLQCGSVFEGDEVTRRRIEDLRTLGNHKMMFDYECLNDTFATSVYPCIGTDVTLWSAPCAEIMTNYWDLRTNVNQEIMSIYDTAVSTVKKLKPRASLQNVFQNFVFQHAMSKIAKLEGDKCQLFNEMRNCVLPRLMQQCGFEAAFAVNTSIGLGYLRTERRERLNLDFRNFDYVLDARCEGL